MAADNATEGVPSITVEASGVSIEVTDARSAEAAMPFIEGALEHHLGTRAKRGQEQPVDVECQKCGYEWEYRGKSARGSTCPGCKKHTRFEPPLDERGVR